MLAVDADVVLVAEHRDGYLDLALVAVDARGFPLPVAGGASARSRPKGLSRRQRGGTEEISGAEVGELGWPCLRTRLLQAKFRCTKARRDGKLHRDAVFRD